VLKPWESGDFTKKHGDCSWDFMDFSFSWDFMDFSWDLMDFNGI
jgi:hypothetical protein